ncbi:NAD-dependent epimerase/dehydratase family protein [Modestobacter muralis]|uniref:NAD-dependent epimerase/dehydratase family protein n=1 Tax=Modestobacter muralis TaxID=1608614 RepID=A0A6P0EXS3_9ACTN|nr:NAD-dependent epimerase/dehydratase family protein [Modestobacter muralis]NEK95660.1 NAD-dependent epimerase/dehydratase family protein [Modestobacter muralis]NEN52548.1 NAD-dependent epimerase/dehydratase family protein [Modestobacter muralis]
MRTLITGGAGFIGSHLSEALVAQGREVVVLDDLSTGRRENLADLELAHPGAVRFVQGSVVDTEVVDDLVAGVEEVYHLAAAVGVFTIQQRTLESLRVNLRGTEAVVEAAARHDARLLVASTSEVYGKNTTIGLREDDDIVLGAPVKSRWSYALAKAIDESVTAQYVQHHGLRGVLVRLFNTVGPRQTGRYGMVMPRFVDQALAGEPLTVFGTGTQTRCFCHVADVVPALTGLMATEAAVGGLFNVGNPEQVSIDGLAERVITRTGSASDVVHLDYADVYGPGYEDMERRVPDCSRIRDLIGWTPRHDLDAIVDAVVASRRQVVPAVPGERSAAARP